MTVDMISVLREQRLTHARKSIIFAETQEKRAANSAQQATAVVTGTSPFAGSEYFTEYRLREMYMHKLEAYNRKPSFAAWNQPFTPHGLALWKRVSKAVKASGIDGKTYIDAQFTFYDTAFKRPPQPKDLTTDAAIVRAASIKPEVTVTNNLPAEVSTTELFKRCEKQMNEIMRAQKLTREEVYRKLVLTRLVAFPDIYLNADPVWRQVRDALR